MENSFLPKINNTITPQIKRRSTSVARNYTTISDEKISAYSIVPGNVYYKTTQKNWRNKINTSFIEKNNESRNIVDTTPQTKTNFLNQTINNNITNKKARKLIDDSVDKIQINSDSSKKSLFPNIKNKARTTLKLFGNSENLNVAREHYTLGTFNPIKTDPVILRAKKYLKETQQVEKKINFEEIKQIYFINFLDGVFFILNNINKRQMYQLK